MSAVASQARVIPVIFTFITDTQVTQLLTQDYYTKVAAASSPRLRGCAAAYTLAIAAATFHSIKVEKQVWAFVIAIIASSVLQFEV